MIAGSELQAALSRVFPCPSGLNRHMLCEDISTAHDRPPSSSIIIKRLSRERHSFRRWQPAKSTFPRWRGTSPENSVRQSVARRDPAKVSCSPHFRADASRTGRLSRRVSGNNVSSRARHVGNDDDPCDSSIFQAVSFLESPFANGAQLRYRNLRVAARVAAILLPPLSLSLPLSLFLFLSFSLSLSLSLSLSSLSLARRRQFDIINSLPLSPRTYLVYRTHNAIRA
jgi:hypothetical protein